MIVVTLGAFHTVKPTPAWAQSGDLLDFGDPPEQKKDVNDEPPATESVRPEARPDRSVDAEDSESAGRSVDEPDEADNADGVGVDEPRDSVNPPSGTVDDKAQTEVSGAVDPASLDRIKAVPRKAVLKKGRLELTPFASLSVNDPFYQHLAVGGSAVYYPHDSFGFGLGFDYLYANAETSNVNAVRQGLTSVPGQFEQPRLFGHFDLYWIPIYGKVSLFDTNILHFEFYATGGLGVASTLDDDGLQPAANFGLGQRMFLGDWFALRIEARDHFYVSSQTVNRIEQSELQSIIMLYLGASFFIPPSFEYSFL